MPPIEADTNPRPANRHWLEGLAALLMLFAALFIASQVDLLLNYLRLWGNQTFVAWPILWGPSIANFVVGLALLPLAWWVACKLERRLWLGLAYFIVGAVATFYFPLIFTFNLGRLGLPMFGALAFGPLTYWTVTGTVLAIVGVLHLWPRR